jgi:hypothetical protein
MIQPGNMKMFSKTGIALSAAIILSTALTASAATKNHGVIHVHHRAIYNTAPDVITNSCLPSDNPCRTQPDGW